VNLIVLSSGDFLANKVMVFAPHPDDAEFYAGGTLAKMIAEGDKVVIN
jgi:LmbE family N-acetylglucosaminyl deacetylase